MKSMCVLWRLQGGMALVLELWMRKTSSRPLRMSPRCRYEDTFSLHTGQEEFISPILSPAPDLLQQGGGGGLDEDPRRAVRR